VKDPNQFSPDPPYLWPDTRALGGHVAYASQPPFRELACQATAVLGVVPDIADAGTEVLQQIVGSRSLTACRLVVVVSTACPTREKHLRALMALEQACKMVQRNVAFRVWPVPSLVRADARVQARPATCLCLYGPDGAPAHLAIGSVNDFGADGWHPYSLNLVFAPAPTLLNSWRQWFDWVWCQASPLTDTAVRIPHLVPAPGEIEAATAWNDYESLCRHLDSPDAAGMTAKVTVDPKTGEVTAVTAGGKPVQAPTDAAGIKRMDPLFARLASVLSKGALVTVDETTRVKPTSISISARLFDQLATRKVGRVTQRQSYTLDILDEDVAKEIEKCRTVAPLLELLGLQLGKGQRWVPAATMPLLEKELGKMNGKAKALLDKEVGKDVAAFCKKREGQIAVDLGDIYRELTGRHPIPEAKLHEVRELIESRLKAIMAGRITPQVCSTPIGVPAQTGSGNLSQWGTLLSLLEDAMTKLREPFADRYFDRNFTGKSFGRVEYLKAMNVFGESWVEDGGGTKLRETAQAEVAEIRDIMASDEDAQAKCRELVELMDLGPHAPQDDADERQGVFSFP
jgi:hypothetical protein